MDPIPIILSIAATQWLVFAGMNLFKRQPRNLLISSAVMAVVWITFAASSAPKARIATAAAISPAASASGTCATLEQGVSADEARAHLGKPDEVWNEEAIRGPEAEAWIYRGTRCAVHLVEGRVTFVE